MKLKTLIAIFLGILVTAGSVQAIEMKICEMPLHFVGFIKQEMSFRFAEEDDFHPVGSISTIQFEPLLQITDKVSLFSVFRLMYDSVYDMRSDSDSFDRLYMPDDSHTRRYIQYEWRRNDRALELLREFYFDITWEQFDFRFGKQQVVWGETDGLRLMDLINPSDWQREFILRDSDEGYESTRIPLWLLKGVYNFKKLPFGFEDASLEFIWNPGDIETTRLNIGNTIGGHPRVLVGRDAVGGTWSFPYPNLPPGVLVSLRDRKKPGHIEYGEYAVRFRGAWKGWDFTLNGFYGWQDFFVLNYTSTDLYLGGAQIAHIPRGVPVDLATAMGFLGLGGNAVFNFDQYYSLSRVLGFTFNKDCSAWFVWQNSSPVLRCEALYEFKKPFNTDGARIGDMAWLPFSADGTGGSHGIIKKDQIRYMIGFDWQIWCKRLNPRETFFTSFQFSQYIIPNYDADDELINAPYYFDKNLSIRPWRVHQYQEYFTFLVNTGYFAKRVVPQVLWVYDFDESATWVKARVDFKFGDRWREEVGVMWIDGKDGVGKSFGLFNFGDQLYFKLTYLIN